MKGSAFAVGIPGLQTGEDVNVRPSRTLAGAVAALHLLAGAAILAAALDWPYRAALLCTVAASLVLSLRRRQGAVLRCQDDGGLAIRRGDDWAPVRLLPDTLVWPWLAVLRYRIDERRATTLAVLPDSLEKDDFRRLRVWLRWGAETKRDAAK